MKAFELPTSVFEIAGAILFIGIIFLANAGGLGGGGILIPIMMIFFQLSIFECVPIANVLGMIAALNRFIVNYKQKHPNPKKAA